MVLTRAFISRQQIDQIAKDILGGLLQGQSEQDIYEESSVQKYELGARKVVNNGGLTRIFYYGGLHASLGNAGRGRVYVASDDGSERGAFLGAQTAGAKTVTWTAVADITLNQFQNGFLLLQGGFVREIRSNTAASAGASSTLTLFDPLPETIAAGRYGILQQNPYKDVVHRGAAPRANSPGAAVGVLGFDGTPGYYAWLQTAGPCGVIATPATLGDADGEQALVLGVNAGAEVGIATGHGYQIIGHSLMNGAINWDNENFMIVDLCIRR